MNGLQDAKVDVKVQIALVWASVMFLYVYGDYFGLYVPGALTAILNGHFPPFGSVTQGVLTGVSLMLAVPALMIALTVVLPARVGRWSNIVVALLYTGIVALTIPGSWTFYVIYSALEMLLTLAVVWLAWRWPKAKVPLS